MAASLLMPGVALAEYQLLPDQQTRVTELTKSLGAALVAGGKTQEEADMAARAVQVTLTVSYFHGATDATADRMAGPVLDAYIKPPGATVRVLDETDLRIIELARTGVREMEGKRLLPPDADAVAYTAGKAARNHLENGESVALMAASLNPIVAPFESLPPLSDPRSPFYNGPPIMVERAAPVPSAASAVPDPQPSVSAAPPENPDGITVIADDGRVIQSVPDDEGGMVTSEYTPESGHDSKNEGNSKNRTGGNDRKEDKKGNSNQSGGGSHSSGGSKHK